MRPLALALLAALPFSAVAAADDAPPAPGASKEAAKRWTFDFSHGPLKRVQADDGTGRVRSLLYMTMKVENKTGLPRDWRPLVTAKVDSREAPYVAGGYGNALDKIRGLEGQADLQCVEYTGWKKGDDGKLANGQALSLVAIFGPVDIHWNTCRVEVHGLLNPITTLKIQKYGDKEIVVEAAYAERNAKVMEEIKAAARASGSEVPAPVAEYRQVREKRAYVMNYRRQGDEYSPDDDPIEPRGERWEVIGDPVTLPLVKTGS
jgi:hypothetical protein